MTALGRSRCSFGFSTQHGFDAAFALGVAHLRTDFAPSRRTPKREAILTPAPLGGWASERQFINNPLSAFCSRSLSQADFRVPPARSCSACL